MAHRRDHLQLRKQLREQARNLGTVPLCHAGVFPLLEKALAGVGDRSTGAADKMLPLAMLQDLLDCTPVTQCPQLLDWLEQHEAQVRRCLIDFQRLILLGFCKRLIGRLSASKDTLYFGRVMFVLANFFEMFERSGLNLQGDVNTMETLFETDGEKAPVIESGEDFIDYTFYKMFWGFQKFFIAPNTVLERMSEFEMQLQSVLSEFDHHLVHYDEGTPAVMPPHPDEELDDDAILPQYLTSRRLMVLQLRDGTFRRCVLAQTLVLLHSLRHFRPTTGSLMNRDLPSAQLAILERLEGKVMEALRAIPPQGAMFADCIAHALGREQHWIAWKQAKPQCPNITKVLGGKLPPPEVTMPPLKRHRMGNADLTRLWKEHDGDMATLSRLAKPAPATAEFLQHVKEQLEPGSGVEKQYLLSRNKLYVWRAQRLVARDNLTTLCKNLGGIDNKPPHELFERLIADLATEAAAPVSPIKVEAKVEAKPEVTLEVKAEAVTEVPAP